MTDAEHRLWYHLRRRQLNNLKFRRQVPFSNYIVDFACFERNLIIEVDGGQHFENQRYDAKRTTYLQARGFSVLRFWNDEVLTETDSVLKKILDFCSD